MKVLWVRGKENLSFTKPKVHFALGQIGSGKSSLLEAIAIQHHKKGAAVLDIFGSVDGEGLSWLRSDLVKNREVLLLKGENVDIKTEHDVKHVDALTLKDLEKHDFIISSHPLYLNRDHEYYSIGKLIGKLYKRLHWRRLICLISREASSLWYSRIKVSESQSDQKNESMYMLREMRHLGVALALDSLRLQSIDIDLRSHMDYLYLKACGVAGLGRDLNWLYGFIRPHVIRNMDPEYFALLTRKGRIGLGQFDFPRFHKMPKEDIVSKVGLKIEYGEVAELPQDRGLYKTVSPKEHAEIVTLYSEGVSMNKIAEKVERSTKTISDHVHSHDNSVRRSGFCPQCRSVKCELECRASRERH